MSPKENLKKKPWDKGILLKNQKSMPRTTHIKETTAAALPPKDDFMTHLCLKLSQGEEVPLSPGDQAMRWEPINKLSPDMAEQTVGKEGFWMGPRHPQSGRPVTGGQLFGYAAAHYPHLVGLIDAEVLSVLCRLLERHPTDAVIRSVNLSSEFFALRPFPLGLLHRFPGDVLFEISEKLTLDTEEEMANLRSRIFDVTSQRFVLDDLPAPRTDSLNRLALFGDRIAWAKVDYAFFQNALRYNTATLQRLLKDHLALARANGYWLVVEGVEELDDWPAAESREFLLKISRSVGYPILIQGCAVRHINGQKGPTSANLRRT